MHIRLAVWRTDLKRIRLEVRPLAGKSGCLPGLGGDNGKEPRERTTGASCLGNRVNGPLLIGFNIK